jgi:hypothetical protein
MPSPAQTAGASSAFVHRFAHSLSLFYHSAGKCGNVISSRTAIHHSPWHCLIVPNPVLFPSPSRPTAMFSYLPAACSHSCLLLLSHSPSRPSAEECTVEAMEPHSLTGRGPLAQFAAQLSGVSRPNRRAQPSGPRTPSAQDPRYTACFFQTDLSPISVLLPPGYERSWDPVHCISVFAFL